MGVWNMQSCFPAVTAAYLLWHPSYTWCTSVIQELMTIHFHKNTCILDGCNWRSWTVWILELTGLNWQIFLIRALLFVRRAQSSNEMKTLSSKLKLLKAAVQFVNGSRWQRDQMWCQSCCQWSGRSCHCHCLLFTSIWCHRGNQLEVSGEQEAVLLYATFFFLYFCLCSPALP